MGRPRKRWPSSPRSSPRRRRLRRRDCTRGCSTPWSATPRSTPSLTALSREQRAEGGVEALTMLTVDFAREEQSAVLRELLSLWPREELDAAFVRWSQEPPSARAWGTLRFLDRSERLGTTMLAPAYARFLDSEALRRAAHGGPRAGAPRSAGAP